MKNKKENIYRIHYKYRYATLTFEKKLSVKPFFGLKIVGFNTATKLYEKIVELQEETTSIFYNTWDKVFEMETQIKLPCETLHEDFTENTISRFKNCGWNCTTIGTDIAIFKELIRYTQENKIPSNIVEY